jgi:hypothetical protein
MIKNPKSVYSELTLWTTLLWKLYRLVPVRNFSSLSEYSEHSWRYKTWVVSWHPSSYLSTHPYRQTWLHKTLDVKVHGVAPLGRSAASGQCLKHFRREVKINCGPKTREICGLACFLLRFCYDGFWCEFETRLKYFDEYQAGIKFKTTLHICSVQRPFQRWVS